MQQVVSPPRLPINPNRNGNGGHSQSTRSQSIMIAAVTLFALSGLLIGFAVGSLNRPKQTQATISSTSKGVTPVATQITSHKATPTVDIAAVGIGCPTITSATSPEIAGSNTTYSLQAQVMDKSIANASNCGKGKPLYAPNITCRLWLTKDEKSLAIPNNILRAVNNFPLFFPGEEQNALNFTGTSQTQPCSLIGETVWHYTLSPSVSKGKYYLVVLADWKGRNYNWSWNIITVTKADN